MGRPAGLTTVVGTGAWAGHSTMLLAACWLGWSVLIGGRARCVVHCAFFSVGEDPHTELASQGDEVHDVASVLARSEEEQKQTSGEPR